MGLLRRTRFGWSLGFLGLVAGPLLGAWACDTAPVAEDTLSQDDDPDELDAADDEPNPPISVGGASGECLPPPGGASAGGAGGAGGATEPETEIRVALPGCPETEPAVSECTGPAQGIQCLYADEEEGCFRSWICLLGIWSPAGKQCQDATLDPWKFSSAQCPSALPVDTTPCTAQLDCTYSNCSYADSHRAVCNCERWEVEEYGCPLVP